MTEPLTILLADDQVPWESNEDNDRTKEEIRREFTVERPDLDVDKGFAENF